MIKPVISEEQLIEDLFHDETSNYDLHKIYLRFHTSVVVLTGWDWYFSEMANDVAWSGVLAEFIVLINRFSGDWVAKAIPNKVFPFGCDLRGSNYNWYHRLEDAVFDRYSVPTEERKYDLIQAI